MIEHPTKSDSNNPTKSDIQHTFNFKNPKKLNFWNFVGLDWIELKNPIQSNPIIQQKSKNPTFFDF
jgi:hypothetical protein